MILFDDLGWVYSYHVPLDNHLNHIIYRCILLYQYLSCNSCSSTVVVLFLNQIGFVSFLNFIQFNYIQPEVYHYKLTLILIRTLDNKFQIILEVVLSFCYSFIYWVPLFHMTCTSAIFDIFLLHCDQSWLTCYSRKCIFYYILYITFFNLFCKATIFGIFNGFFLSKNKNLFNFLFQTCDSLWIYFIWISSKFFTRFSTWRQGESEYQMCLSRQVSREISF